MADQRLIPESIRDSSTSAFNALIDRMGTLDITPLLVYLIDDVPASVLPHLAEQFHITGYEGWLLAATDAERRALIKTSIELHRYKGTRWAIEHVLAVLGYNGVVSEWFQHGGEPYTFRVVITYTGTRLTPTDLHRLAVMIQEYKNERSHGSMTLRDGSAFRAGVSHCGDRLGYCDSTATLDALITMEAA